MRRLLWLTLSSGAVAAGLLFAETTSVSKHTVWVVPWNHQGTLRVQSGDVIEVWTRPIPFIPENLDVRFRASKVGPGVDLVGDTVPHKEGSMERLYFFRAFDPGPAVLKVEQVDGDGKVCETWTYQVEVSSCSQDQPQG